MEHEKKKNTHTHILRLFCHLLSLEQKRALFSIHLQDPRAEKTPTRQARAEHRCRAPSGFAPRCRPRCCSESNTPESFPPIGTAEWGTWREKRGRGAADSSCGLRLLSSYTSSPTQPYPSLTPNPSLHKGGSRDWQGWPRNSAAFFGIWSDSLRFRTSVVLICLKIRARVLSYIPSRAQCGNQFLEEMVSNPQPERTARPKRRARPITDRGVPRGFCLQHRVATKPFSPQMHTCYDASLANLLATSDVATNFPSKAVQVGAFRNNASITMQVPSRQKRLASDCVELLRDYTAPPEPPSASQ